MSSNALSLALLVLQNASIVLLVSYSKSRTQRYASSVVVAVTELIKGAVSLIGWWVAVRRATWLSLRDRNELLKISVPGALYALQNNLNFYALSNLSSPVYHVSYQSRILTTALIGSLAFGKRLSTLKWAALALLFVGVAIVQLDNEGDANSNTKGHKRNEGLGFLAVAAACTTSGFAGCWFEWLLRGSPKQKQPPASLWVRNVQLAFVCLIFALFAVRFDHTLQDRKLFDGFSWLVWLVVLNASVGGLLVAIVVRNSGAVAKGFATSLSIVLSTVVNAIAVGEAPGSQFLLGAALVIVATLLFSLR